MVKLSSILVTVLLLKLLRMREDHLVSFLFALVYVSDALGHCVGFFACPWLVTDCKCGLVTILKRMFQEAMNVPKVGKYC